MRSNGHAAPSARRICLLGALAKICQGSPRRYFRKLLLLVSPRGVEKRCCRRGRRRIARAQSAYLCRRRWGRPPKQIAPVRSRRDRHSIWPGCRSRPPILCAPDRFDVTSLPSRSHFSDHIRKTACVSSRGRCCLSLRPGEHFLRRADRHFGRAAPAKKQANLQPPWPCCLAASPYRSKRGGCWALLPTGIRWSEPVQARKTHKAQPTEQSISWQFSNVKPSE